MTVLVGKSAKPLPTTEIIAKRYLTAARRLSAYVRGAKFTAQWEYGKGGSTRMVGLLIES